MPNPVVMLPLDYTGLEVGNRITNEAASIGVGQQRLVIPVYHPFFRESLILVDNATGSPLTDAQFFCTDLDQELTMRCAKEIYTAIVIADVTVSNDIRLTYQSIGGPYARDRQALITWLEQRKDTGGNEDWADVTDKPKLYNPEMGHKHLLAHIYGMEYVVAGLKRVEEAVIIGDHGAYAKVQQNLDRLMALATTRGHQIATEVINNRITGVTSGISKDALGLGLLENLSPLSRNLAREIAKPSYGLPSVFEDHYTTILGQDAFNEQLQEELVSRFTTGLGDNNGSYIDSTRPSLLVLPNGAVFTLRSKKAIVDRGEYYDANVYPEGTMEGDEFVITRITNSVTHAGGIFMLFNKNNQDTYIGNLQNDGCRSPIKWRKMYFDNELDELNKLIQAHINDTKNPHNLTAEDVDLKFVENLPVITTDEIDAKKSVRKYLTLDTLYYYMKKFMTNAQAPAPPNSTVDPTKPTMDQAQIIFTSCRKPPPDAVHPNKGQLIKTYCDGSDKFGKFTDGTGGYYDEVIELNSDDCNYVANPPKGTLINTFCDGTTKKGKYANGTGGDYVETIELKSEDCGYEKPPSQGTILAVFCSGVDKITRYADGNGGHYDMPSEFYSPDCMLETPAPTAAPTAAPTFSPPPATTFPPTTTRPPTTPPPVTSPPPANRSISFTATSPIAYGASGWMTANLAGYPANSTVNVEFFVRVNGSTTNIGSQSATVSGTGSRQVSIPFTYNDPALAGTWTVFARTTGPEVVSNNATVVFSAVPSTPPPSGPITRALNYQSNEGNGTCDAVFDPSTGTISFYWSGTTQSIHGNNGGGNRIVSGAMSGSGVFYNASNGVLVGANSSILNSLSYMTYTFTASGGY